MRIRIVEPTRMIAAANKNYRLSILLVLIAIISLPVASSTAFAQGDANLRLNNISKQKYGWKFGKRRNKSYLNIPFNGIDRDVILHTRGWDIDSDSEISISINGVLIGHLPKSHRNERYAPRMLFYIPKKHIIEGKNTIKLSQTVPNNKWGVTELGVFKAGSAKSMFGNLRPLKKDTSHIGRVNLRMAYGDSPQRLTIKFFDIDDANEILIKSGSSVLGNAPVTDNNAWGDELTYDIAAGGQTIVINNTYNGPKKYIWGVKIISAADASGALPAHDEQEPILEPPQEPVNTFDSLGFTVVDDATWDETAVRQVLQTFAWGGHAKDSQISKWAQLSPTDAIVEMLNFDQHNLKLSPLSPVDRDRLDLVPNTLRGLSNFWTSNASRNPVPESFKDSLKVGWGVHHIWSYAAIARGLNPFRHKIGLWETNYHMAVNMNTSVNPSQLVRYYDDIMSTHERGKTYEDVMSIAARSAAIATQYQHRRNRFRKGECECNEDFAREYFQLFFGILGEGDSAYHESVTIKNMSHALTDMRVVWDSTGQLKNVVDFQTQYHYQQPLEMLHTSITGTNAMQRINKLSDHAIAHHESQNNLPVRIIRDLADDNLDDTKIYQIRNAWRSMPDDAKNFLHFIRAYAISDLFHSKDRYKYWTTFDRHIIVANRFLHSNKELYANLYTPAWLFPDEDVQVFRPKHNVFGGQTSMEAAVNDRVFAASYQEATKGIWRYVSTSGTNKGITWNKDWGAIIPKNSSGQWRVKDVADWLWQHIIADGLDNFSSLEKAHLYAFLGADTDLMQLLNPDALNEVITPTMVDNNEDIQALLKTLKNQRLYLDHPNVTVRQNANFNIGEAFAFIIATPYNFAQQGRE